MEIRNKNNHIVITSINEPTEGVLLFSKMKDYKLIVIGDNKSPENWFCKNVDYYSSTNQLKLNFELVNILPYNHYCRKMIGYLIAIKNGAEYIIDTDDDNIPKLDWCFPEFEGTYETIEENKGFVNIYQLYTKTKIWARGLPLKLINTDFKLEDFLEEKKCNVGIWQGLADGDPDVDAIYRLTNDEPCFFNNRKPVVIGKNTISPFNTQNTIIKKELFPLLYLPTYVTFRFTDILRGLVAQPIMWLYGYELGFTNATVVQKRNPHDYMIDFISEIPMFENCEKVVEIVSENIYKDKTIEFNLYSAYKALLKENIIEKRELLVLSKWLEDLKKINL
ncbi:STELLO glycosyltransferase family protein [Polaribacter sp. KT 15]|uniref:STELLO glycosyltransferase family protein n=1 Tax=Polaribacter sp. KT 15 TaxID=1896175 RepID=UPI00090AC791|nr:STELLO glycosyltransferase family protein [Polaribacter sp. KT 15]SHN09775.1 Protein of unknown function, DUF288 [Polaribacter sp. KT 15]